DFRHPERDDWRGLTVMDPREELAHEKGLQYVGLDGTVGIIANGAGLAMSTCDVVNQVGGSPANFLDIGGGASAEVMANALEVINSDDKVKAIFINIVGGVNPKRAGEEVEGVPVFGSVKDAVAATGATASFVAVGEAGASGAIIEAAEAGIALVVCITEGIPAQDEAKTFNVLLRDFPK